MVHLRFAHVGIHQQHPLPQFTEGFSQQHCHQTLALPGHRRAQGNGAQRRFGAEEAQAGVEVAEGLLVEEALITINAGGFAVEFGQQEAFFTPHTLEEADVGHVA